MLERWDGAVPARRQIGFVAGTTPGNEALSHNRLPPRAVPQMLQSAQVWLCFASFVHSELGPAQVGPELGLFDAIEPGAGWIGLSNAVDRVWRPGLPHRFLPAGPNWVCLYNRPRKPWQWAAGPSESGIRNPKSAMEELALFRTFSQKKHVAQRGHSREGGNPLGRGERIIPGSGGATCLPLSFLVFQVVNHNSSIINQVVPLPRGRVARIVPEFRAQRAPENGATPCSHRNNVLPARGVFYLLNCCTN